MTPEEIQKEQDNLLAKVGERVESLHKKAFAENADLKEISVLKADLAKVQDGMKSFATAEDMKALKAQNEAIGLSVKAFSETGGNNSQKIKGWKEQFAVLYTKAKTDIADVISGKRRDMIHFEIKAAADTITVENTIGAGDEKITITENTGIITAFRKRLLQYLSNVTVAGTNSPIVAWSEQVDENGVPLMIGEGDTKIQVDSHWEGKNTSVKKIGLFAKVSTEMLADLPNLIGFIQANLMKRMEIKLEDQLFGGDGNGNNLLGIISVATAFDAGNLINIISPNEIDVIRAIKNQVAIANGEMTGIFVHPTTRAKMDLTKTADGLYTIPAWAPYNGTVAGVKVIETLAMAEDQFLGGDLSVIQVRIREAASIQIGMDGNDFTNNLRTILAEMRLAQFVSGNDTGVLVTGLFSESITALEATS
jgi:hypothetical protein